MLEKELGNIENVQPEIFPTVNETIQFEFRNEKDWLEIEISNDMSYIDCFMFKNSKETEQQCPLDEFSKVMESFMDTNSKDHSKDQSKELKGFWSHSTNCIMIWILCILVLFIGLWSVSATLPRLTCDNYFMFFKSEEFLKMVSFMKTIYRCIQDFIAYLPNGCLLYL